MYPPYGEFTIPYILIMMKNISTGFDSTLKLYRLLKSSVMGETEAKNYSGCLESPFGGNRKVDIKIIKINQAL